jgi:hypothetical protein
MSEIRYPAKVISYKVFFSESNAQLKLFGLEEGQEADAEVFFSTKTLANIDFVHIKENASPSFKAFINRGGYLQTTRPLWLLSSILVLLEKVGNIQIDGNGNLSKTQTLNEVLT